MEFVISYDMRAPAFGAPVGDLYAAALDQCAWADDLGFDCVGFGNDMKMQVTDCLVR